MQPTPAAAKAVLEPDDFEKWLGERPKWLQTAAHQLIQSKAQPTAPELAALSALCLAEATGGGNHVFSVVVPGSMVLAAARPALRIKGLSEVRGVNRVKDKASLSFGDTNLTCVYGANGSGKTGYSRVLKQACGSRAREEIHPNVFNKLNPPCSAKISITVNGTAHDLDWTLIGGAVKQLTNVHVFDSKTAANYVISANEARYEPSRMRFVTNLIATCDNVSDHLNSQKLTLPKKLPQTPFDLAQTTGGKWIAALKATTTSESIAKACAYTESMDKERITAEGALAQQDIAGRLAAIGRERANLDQLKITFASIKLGLSDANAAALIAARVDAAAKRKAATEAAQAVFAKAPLAGVGQQTWMKLWEQAELYSSTHAYPGVAFPNVAENAKCVLCQQELGEDAATRLGHFKEFVVGGLEASAKTAESDYSVLLQRLPVLPQADAWALQVAILKLEEAVANALFDAMTARHTALQTSTDAVTVPALDWTEAEAANLKVSETLNAEEKSLKELQQDGKRKQLEQRVLELRAAQWLNQNQVAITEEVARLVSLGLIDKAIKLASTTALTNRHKELAKEDLHIGYQTRFADELKRLGGKKLPVVPEGTAKGKGKITFSLSLKNVEHPLTADKVLSEGETRIVALAAFLADISGSDRQTPFIFDDPISSLDQDFEERVVKRLVEISKTRQVIVFTHRLSLVALLEAEAKKIKDEAELAKAPPSVKLHVASVCSFGKESGVVQELRARDMKPLAAFKLLKNDVLPKLRKLQESGDVAQYDERANGVCSDLRIVVERTVESVLMNDVLNRFRRSLQTQGRIGSLAKISTTDCAMIDDLMTRYSVFEHSQSDELPAARPELEDIEADVTRLIAWIDEFDKRAVAK